MTFFQNPDDRALFLKHAIVKAERTALLPGSGIDPELFAPRPRGHGPFTFLLAARLLKAKGVEDFVTAARRVKATHGNARFVLAGSHDPQDSEYADSFMLSCAEKDRVVERVGHVDDIRPLIASADCVVLPSYYREGVPRSLLEAASMGKPLIAADSVGTREPVRDGENGLLCSPRNPTDLAAKMECMLEMSAELLAEMGSKSRRFMIERFDERVVIEKYLEEIERLAAL